MLLIPLAIAPAAAIMWYIYSRDEYEKEPLQMLVLSFAFGIMSVFPALKGSELGAMFIEEDAYSLWLTFLYSFIVIALSEEAAKFFFLRFFMYPRKDFNEPFDGIVYAVMIGMGFATFENIIYVMNGGFSVAILRAFTAVPAHAAFGIVMGYYVGMAKFDPKNRFRFFAVGLLAATALHGAYDFFLLQQRYDILGLLAFVVLIYAIRMSRLAIQLHQKESPFNPDNIQEEELTNTTSNKPPNWLNTNSNVNKDDASKNTDEFDNLSK